MKTEQMLGELIEGSKKLTKRIGRLETSAKEDASEVAVAKKMEAAAKEIKKALAKKLGAIIKGMLQNIEKTENLQKHVKNWGKQDLNTSFPLTDVEIMKNLLKSVNELTKTIKDSQSKRKTKSSGGDMTGSCKKLRDPSILCCSTRES